MVQYFFASPADIQAFFQEVERTLDLCYVWGVDAAPSPDLLKIFDSCTEIDCFGYAIDPTYWIDIHRRDTPLHLVQNAQGYYVSNERVQLRVCNTAADARPDRAMVLNELYCPPGAQPQTRSLFLSLKRAMQRRWQKIDGVLYGPEVFQERERLMFFDDTDFSFSGDERYAATWETWFGSLAPEVKNTPFLPPPPALTLCFYASSGDMLALFQQLETQHTSMRYWCGNESIRFEHVDQLFSERFQDAKAPTTFRAVDGCTHNAIQVVLGGLRPGLKGVVVPGSITYLRAYPIYGGTLLRKIGQLLKECFHPTVLQRYGVYYMGPDIWDMRETLIFDHGDPRFRWADGDYINVWRKEWDAFLSAAGGPL